MAFYGNKFRRLLETLIQSEGQTKIGKRLGSKFVITCNPELIQKLYDDPQITRSSVSRRMTEQYGAGEFSVSQPLDRSRIKRQELKAFLNNPMYKKILRASLKHFDTYILETKEQSKVDLYLCVRNSLQRGLMEEFLGVDYNETLRNKIKEIGFSIDTKLEEPFEKLFIMNFIPLPMWLKNIFSPILKEKNDKFQKTVEIIYDKATVKPNGWLAKLKQMESDGILTRQEVLGEIRGMYINADTMAID